MENFTCQSKKINGIDVFLLHVDNNLANINESIIPLSQLSDIKTYRIQHDRNKRLIARTFLYKYLNVTFEINSFELAYGKYKKPYLKNNENIHFSISYSNEYILIAVSDKYEIGCDIEYIDHVIPYNEIKNIIMHKNELTYSKILLDHTSKVNFFFDVFNSKEVIIKALGTGLYLDVQTINILGMKDSNLLGYSYKNVCLEKIFLVRFLIIKLHYVY